jgi:competence protein ComEA
VSARQRSVLTLLGYGLLLALVVTGALMVVNRRAAGQPVLLAEPPTPSPLRVHVTGAVVAPGVYQLAPGSIVQNAIEAAGGALADADPGVLNLARLLHDGDQVLVPARAALGTAVVSPGTSPAEATAPAPTGPVNLNTASAADLETLPGIGPSLAQRNVDYRAEHGPFATIEAIMDVPGIGEGKFEAIKDLVTV